MCSSYGKGVGTPSGSAVQGKEQIMMMIHCLFQVIISPLHLIPSEHVQGNKMGQRQLAFMKPHRRDITLSQTTTWSIVLVINSVNLELFGPDDAPKRRTAKAICLLMVDRKGREFCFCSKMVIAFVV